MAYFINSMAEALGMTFILFLSSAVVGLWVLLNFTPCNTGKNSFFDCSILNYFKILLRYVLIEKTYQAFWSISIDLDAQYVSSFTEVFLLKTPFKHSYMLCRIILLYFRSTIYTYQKCCNAPTHFLLNTGFTASLYNTISFDQLIKAYIPTPRCLHQSIDGSLELAYFVSTFRIDKTSWLHHIQLFFNKSIKECSFVYPFAIFHKMRQLLTWFRQT